MPRTIDDLLNTPNPMDLSRAYGEQMGRLQSAYADPYDTPGMTGLPQRSSMTPPNYAFFRQPFQTPPPAVMTTPGVTGMFGRPQDMATQFQLAATQQYLNPATAQQNFATNRIGAFGERYGEVLGAGVGGLAGGAIGGPGGAATGVNWGSMVGGAFGSTIMNAIPGLNWIHRQMYGDAGNQLMMMANLQHRTMGNISLTGQDVGLGGRGMNTESALRLGRRLEGMSQQSGGTFNRMDMLNLTETAGNLGMLSAAENIDQIGDTVGKLMKIVGKMAKLTGDPDFRNNLRELSNLQRSGMTINEAVSAVADLSGYAKTAGMTRGQLMQNGGQRGMAAFAQLGLAPGAGLMTGAYGAAQGRILGGAFSPLQQSLIGDTSQQVIQSQAAFMAGPAKFMLPAALGVGANGQLSVDKDKLAALSAPGAMNQLTATIGGGATNMHRVAQQIAESSGRSVQDVLQELMARMPEFQSQMALDLGPRGMQRMQLNTMAGFMKTLGPGNSWQSAMLASGGDASQAQILMKQAADPRVYRREREALLRDLKDAKMEAREEFGGKLAGLDAASEQVRDRYTQLTMRPTYNPLNALFGRTITPQNTNMLDFTGSASAQEGFLKYAGPSASKLRNDQAADEEARRLFEENAAAEGVDRLYTGGALFRSLGERAVERAKKDAKPLTTTFVKGKVNLDRGFDHIFELQKADINMLTQGELEAGRLMAGTGGFRSGLQDIIGGIDSFVGGIDNVFGGPEGDVASYQDPMYKQLALAATVTQKLSHRVSKLTFEQKVKQQRALSEELSKGKGVSGPSALAAVRDRVVGAARQLAADGKGLDMREMRKVAVDALVSAHVDPDVARDMVNKSSKGAFDEMIMGMVMDDPDAKVSVDRADAAGTLAARLGIKGQKNLADKLRVEYKKSLTSMGVVNRVRFKGDVEMVWDWLSGEGYSSIEFGDISNDESEAIGEFTDLSSEEQAAVMLTLQGGSEYQKTITSGSPETVATLKQAKSFVNNLSKEGRAALTRMSGSAKKSGLGTLEKLTGATKEAAETGKGFFGRITTAQRALAQLKAGPTEEADGTSSTDDGEAGDKVKKITKDLKTLEQMRALFVGEGGIAPELQQAAKAMQYSAYKLAAVLQKKGGPPSPTDRTEE